MADEKQNNIDDDEIIQIPDLDEEQSEEQAENIEEIENSEGLAEDDVPTTPEPEEVTTKETVTEEKIVVKTSKDSKDKNVMKDGEKEAAEKTSKDDTIADLGDQSEGKFKKLWRKYLEKKKITIPLTILMVIALLLAIPFTRYEILGLFIKKSVNVMIMDAETSRPVSEVSVTIDGQTGKTNGNGFASIAGVRVGNRTITATKKYYQDLSSNVLVKVKDETKVDLKIQATGRQVPVAVVNAISGKAVKGVVVSSGESTASTDDNGKTTIVLPPESQTEKATLKLQGYNAKDITIKVTDQDVTDNQFTITPSGKVYFLSKKSGKIDVVKTNLDGTDRETVLGGTGSEDENTTSLLASRDWKYLALHANRDGKEKMYLITTSDDKLTTMDEGDATFGPIGWSGDTFVFTVNRNNVQFWQPKRYALKSYDANSKYLKTIDETSAEGTSDIDYASESLEQVYIADNQLVYVKNWNGDYYSGGKVVGKNNTINSVLPDGGSKKVIKEFAVTTTNNPYITAIQYKPKEIYFQVNSGGGNIFYEYDDTKFEEAPTLTPDKFYSFYPTYLLSPSGTKTYWAEPRDGKNTLFIGNADGEDGQEVASLSEYQPYGWYTDEYVLQSKGGSELYVSTPANVDKALKISDYHKPNVNFNGYGGGYGGF